MFLRKRNVRPWRFAGETARRHRNWREHGRSRPDFSMRHHVTNVHLISDRLHGPSTRQAMPRLRPWLRTACRCWASVSSRPVPLPAHSNARTASIANPKSSARSSTPVGRLRRTVQAERGGVPASPTYPGSRVRLATGMHRLWPLRYDRTFEAPDDGRAQG